ncbi:MAG: T9SS type A sorting domain-containing protein [Candidatus Marinimicrobia bacterium]|nr:T9SS type A sorting domain-containing protein [Candidatus Neomarinimicrobiota bacterium]
MKKTVISLFVMIIMLSFAVADGGFVQTGVAPGYIVGTDTLFDGIPNDAARGILAGTDLDGDGFKEVWVSSYTGKRVFCFEEAGTDTFAFVWASAPTTADYTTPRDIHTGDLDGDGFGEIIFHVGRWTGDTNPDAGLHIYEYDGTDNGYGETAAFRVDFMDALNDSLAESRVEGFTVGDIDSDGMDEILIANNGTTNPLAGWGTQDGATPYSGDRFIVLSVSGDIGGFGTSIVEEYSMSPRDVDKDGVRENALGGGSPQDIVICDIDGDGFKEAACFSWNNLAMFLFEATGPDSYTLGDTTYLKLGVADDWTLGASVADMNGDGKDEIYVAGYYDGSMFVITDSDGEATTIDQTGAPGDWSGNTEVAIIHEFGGYAGFGTDADANFGVLHGGAAGVSDINLFELEFGGNPLVAGDWTHRIFELSDATTGHGFKAKLTDFDADGNYEAVLPYMGVNDTTATGELDPNGNRVFRIAEWDGSMVSIRDITMIMPGDYNLSQNFPNPFNPTTRIEYYLPMSNTISLTIYNMLGQEVVKLVENKYSSAGSHHLVWNGADMYGNKVGSGTYIYELRFGNFSITKTMTLLK